MDTTEPPFKVEAWSKKGQSIDRLIATATNVRQAFAVALAIVKPSCRDVLRQLRLGLLIGLGFETPM
jgi:hypothetical protein